MVVFFSTTPAIGSVHEPGLALLTVNSIVVLYPAFEPVCRALLLLSPYRN